MESIKKDGAKAVVDGLGIPPGAKLYSGPAQSAPVVGTVPSGDSVLVSEPVVWTDKTGGTWLAFFIECGGPNLYWASLEQIKQHDKASAAVLSSLIRQLSAAPPYTKTGRASLLPVTVKGKTLTWNDPGIRFSVGRGQLISDNS